MVLGQAPLRPLATIDTAVIIGGLHLAPLGGGKISHRRPAFAGTSSGIIGMLLFRMRSTPCPLLCRRLLAMRGFIYGLLYTDCFAVRLPIDTLRCTGFVTMDQSIRTEFFAVGSTIRSIRDTTFHFMGGIMSALIDQRFITMGSIIGGIFGAFLLEVTRTIGGILLALPLALFCCERRALFSCRLFGNHRACTSHTACVARGSALTFAELSLAIKALYLSILPS